MCIEKYNLVSLTDSKDYDVFGTQLSVTNGINSLYESTISTSYGYLGKPYDATTRLYNYGYRDYSSRVGRFTTVDPVRDGSNWYAYVNNDPVNYVDLWGEDAIAVAITIGSIGIAIPEGVTSLLGGAIIGAALAIAGDKAIDYLNSKQPVRDDEGNPIPPGNQSPGPLGKGANSGPENIPDPSSLGEPGKIPPEFNGIGVIFATAASIANLDDSTQLWKDSLESMIENNNSLIQPDTYSEVVILRDGENK